MRQKALCVLFALVGFEPLHAQTITKEQLEKFQAYKVPEFCRVIEFEKAEIVGGVISDTWFAVVSGNKPWEGMRVDLVPLVYIGDKPDYWGIEVVGCLSGINLPKVTAYTVELLLTDDVIGNKGLQIIGANDKSEELDVPGR